MGGRGRGILANDGTSGDTVNATKSASFTLSNTELKTTDGMDLLLQGTATTPFLTANLTDITRPQPYLYRRWLDWDRSADRIGHGHARGYEGWRIRPE